MKFIDAISVLTADQEKVGEIERVVIDPSSREITHLVIGKGILHAVDTIVPVALVAEANEYWVLLLVFQKKSR